MKNILKVAAATFLLLSGTACSDFLDEDLKKNWHRIIPTPVLMVSRWV